MNDTEIEDVSRMLMQRLKLHYRVNLAGRVPVHAGFQHEILIGVLLGESTYSEISEGVLKKLALPAEFNGMYADVGYSEPGLLEHIATEMEYLNRTMKESERVRDNAWRTVARCERLGWVTLDEWGRERERDE